MMCGIASFTPESTVDTVSVTKRSYSTSQDSREFRRAKRVAQEKAVLASSPALTKTSKGTVDDLDICSIRWMELHN